MDKDKQAAAARKEEAAAKINGVVAARKEEAAAKVAKDGRDDVDAGFVDLAGEVSAVRWAGDLAAAIGEYEVAYSRRPRGLEVHVDVLVELKRLYNAGQAVALGLTKSRETGWVWAGLPLRVRESGDPRRCRLLDKV